MNQEMQLSNTMQTAGGDFWTQGTTLTAPTSVMPPPPIGAPRLSPLAKVHRLLRGRYPVAVVLAAAGAVAGALGAYMAITPKFESKGLISINPVVTTTNLNDSMLPMWSMVLASETSLIQSTPVAEGAVADPKFLAAWQKAYHGAEPPLAADFLANLTADRDRTSPLITVTFQDKDPRVAVAGTQAAVKSFMDHDGDVGTADRGRKLVYIRNQLKDLNVALDADQNQLATLGSQYGLEIGPLQSGAQDDYMKAQAQLDVAKLAYESAINPKGRSQVTDANRPFVYQQIAAIDDGMRQAMATRQDVADRLEQIKGTYGVNHPAYQGLVLQLAQRDKEVDSYAHAFLQTKAGQIPFTAPDDAANSNTPFLKSRVDADQVEVDAKNKQMKDLAALNANILRCRQQIARDQEAIASANTRIQQLQDENNLANNVKVVSSGGPAEPAANRRTFAAAAGFFFGGLIPLGAVMLYGLTDGRFRYSDDTAHADLQGVTLLGILPNLPDRLSDPQQAGVAAHCVHQIRTMLQINRSNDEPQVLAVTSAAPGDGKTSLTLALGLSYAACGARTLLIDCDLVAAGLSHRLNVKSPEGVLEAVANRALLEYVRTTDIADVAILPVGTTHAHHASTLSPVALRRLLSEAKKQFDIILVDTGPILGSIEASLVCAAADRTILAVARGQQRPLVERSIGHLNAIGSRLAGVVFNRAQTRDFERSMSGLALRSRPATGTANGQAAAAGVAGSFRRTA